MAAAARYTANHPQPSHCSTCNTTRYTTRNAAETLPRGSISGQDRKIDLYFHFIPLKPQNASKLQNASKMLPLAAVR